MFATTESFRAARSPSGRVDKLNRVIYGVAIVEKGPVRFDPRKQYADDETLQQVLDLGRRSADGVKSHLSHGDDATDGIFNHLGRFRNFRIVGNATVADLYVAASAKDGDYILNLAAEDPQAFGASMLCSLDRKAPRRGDGFCTGAEPDSLQPWRTNGINQSSRHQIPRPHEVNDEIPLP